MNRNLMLLGLACVAFYLWNKSKGTDPNARGVAVVTNADGSKSTVPAWYGRDYTVDGQTYQHSVPDVYFDARAYPPGVLVGPPIPGTVN